MKKLYVINNSGQKEPFSWKKICISAERVGASKELARQIATVIEREAYPGITTKEIFQRVEQILSKKYPRGRIRFRLKEAIRRLGPSGFPFEKYVGGILRQLGFSIKLNQHIKGQYVDHEIDFVAKEKEYCLIGECKYHGLPGGRVDLKVGLIHNSRCLDLISGDACKKIKSKKLKIRPIIVTNTKFTSEIIKYAEGVGIDLLGWKYPELTGLEYIIESEKFYPITILPSLTNDLLEIFGQKKLMLVQDVLKIDVSKFSKKINIPEKKISAIKREAEILLLEK
ncbi:MAG TPA: hypothetical protein VFD40_01395 [Candidatus Paceibacterota bacterium]|nr:hypothetical protein [Candidatus Paceibacterota bacterium]